MRILSAQMYVVDRNWRHNVRAWFQASARSMEISVSRLLASSTSSSTCPSSPAAEGLRFKPRVEAAGISEPSLAGTVIPGRVVAPSHSAESRFPHSA